MFIIILQILVFLTIYRSYQKCCYTMYHSAKKLKEKTALITGGTAGIGLEIAKDLAKRGARVIIACPFENEGLDAKKLIIKESGNLDVIYRHLDLSSLASVRQFAESIQSSEERLDILVNNAGICLAEDYLTKDGMNFVMQVNYYGHFLLTILLLPLLRRTGNQSESARIVNVSSLSHRGASLEIDRYNQVGYWLRMAIYFNSKLSLVLFSREIKKRLPNTNVVINCADPGVVETGIYKPMTVFARWFIYIMLLFSRTPLEGAQTAIFLAVADIGNVSGGYFADCRKIRASGKAYDEVSARRLWDQSVKLVKLSDDEMRVATE